MASNDEKHQAIVEMLKQISESQLEAKEAVYQLDKKVDLHIQKTEYELEKINRLDDIQNQLLDQHIAGVNTLKKWCDQHEEANRLSFEKLEEPRKWIAMTTKIVLTTGAITTALLGLYELIKMLKG